VVDAVRATVPLLAAARERNIPIIYTRVLYHPSGADGGLFVQKVPALRRMIEGEPLAEIVPELPPAPDDVILIKQYASAFFGTSLAAMLTARGTDTLVITGCSTSGCVRATAVDAMQYGFRPIVPRECVGDRHDGPHEANLFDINAKYGDVVALADVMSRLEETSGRPS
jgi:maleamate amidohydrolase